MPHKKSLSLSDDLKDIAHGIVIGMDISVEDANKIHGMIERNITGVDPTALKKLPEKTLR